jgi:hypothetical protein
MTFLNTCEIHVIIVWFLDAYIGRYCPYVVGSNYNFKCSTGLYFQLFKVNLLPTSYVETITLLMLNY